MQKIVGDTQKFLDILNEIKKYVLIINPDIIDHYDVNNMDYYDEEDLAELKKYRYHSMVADTLKLKKFRQELWESYKVKHIGYQRARSNDDDDISYDIFQYGRKFFGVPSYGRYYWLETLELRPRKYIRFDPLEE